MYNKNGRKWLLAIHLSHMLETLIFAQAPMERHLSSIQLTFSNSVHSAQKNWLKPQTHLFLSLLQPARDSTVTPFSFLYFVKNGHKLAIGYTWRNVLIYRVEWQTQTFAPAITCSAMPTDISWIQCFTVSLERDILSNFPAASSPIKFLTCILATGKQVTQQSFKLSCFGQLGETLHMMLSQSLLTFGKTGSFGPDAIFYFLPKLLKRTLILVFLFCVRSDSRCRIYKLCFTDALKRVFMHTTHCGKHSPL